MRTKRIAVVVVAAICGFAATGGASAGDASAGRAMAQKLCARCHAIGPVGDSPVPEAPPLRTLSAKYPIDSLAEAFAEGIVVGHPSMPEFKFEPDAIDALLAYLDSIQPE
ncbi:MAG: c-type cytochrome [Hyphomicrobiales bacterium]